jgi:hypothetical protein
LKARPLKPYPAEPNTPIPLTCFSPLADSEGGRGGVRSGEGRDSGDFHRQFLFINAYISPVDINICVIVF